ncbi:MAG: hypothetical protein SFU56_12135 [Capsulimonadales bacterium]|nr:hypothetical protein [Capsulimonadales bacterium]
MATLFATWITAHVRRRSVRRSDRVRRVVGENGGRTTARPLLDGHYRGRSVRLTQSGDWTHVTVTARNVSGIFAEFDNRSDRSVDWLTPSCRKRLNAVAARWSVAVRGRTILLGCLDVQGPERIRFALDVACDLADVIDWNESVTLRE